ncbi:MAG TPA: mismatch-specific DNA-glycosylase [Symbiobacteriaceae bacterium]|jgi:TDG/mug DNA glycosylase family protein
MTAGLRGDLGLPPLPDYLQPGLKVVFIGFNPGERSAQVGHYYGYPGNRFWWLLWQSGLTDRQLLPAEDAGLPAYGYGITDLVDRPSKSSGDLAGWELRSGREQLLDKLRAFRPQVACFNGKGVYAAAAGVKRVAYGFQPDSLVTGVQDFVAASPSGRNREPVSEKLRLYRVLRVHIK